MAITEEQIADYFKSKGISRPDIKPKPQPVFREAAPPKADIWELDDLTKFFKYFPLPSTLVLKCRYGDQIINNPQEFIANLLSVLTANPLNDEYRPYETQLTNIRDLLKKSSTGLSA